MKVRNPPCLPSLSFFTNRLCALSLVQVPEGFNLEQCTTLGSSVVAAFHALNNELGLPIPTEPGASKSSAHEANEVLNSPVLVWGGSTATGFYAVQVRQRVVLSSSPPDTGLY